MRVSFSFFQANIFLQPVRFASTKLIYPATRGRAIVNNTVRHVTCPTIHFPPDKVKAPAAETKTYSVGAAEKKLTDCLVLHHLLDGATSKQYGRQQRSEENADFTATSTAARRKTVLMPTWFHAKRQHVHHYCDFYLARGMDVLQVIMPPSILLSQARTHVVMDDLLHYLDSEEKDSLFFVHSFSAGSYTYAQMIMRARQMGNYNHILNSICGVFTDSFANLENAASGVAHSITSNGVLKSAIQGLIEAYIALGYTKHVVETYRVTHSEPLPGVPWLLNYSSTDLIGTPAVNKDFVMRMRRQGVDAQAKEWKDCGHCQIMRRYPAEYWATLENFIDKIELLK